LRNISNLLNELGEKSEIELVVHGPGLSAALATAPHAVQLRELLNHGIAVAACANVKVGPIFDRNPSLTRSDHLAGQDASIAVATA
jgi:hypothetical protein